MAVVDSDCTKSLGSDRSIGGNLEQTVSRMYEKKPLAIVTRGILVIICDSLLRTRFDFGEVLQLFDGELNRKIL